MSFDHLFIRDVEGERRFDAADLPLRVGTGTDCQLRLPGPGGEPFALIDLLDVPRKLFRRHIAERSDH